MRGIALDAAGELELTTGLSEPVTRPGEVKIKVLAGGVCGSDLHSIASKVARPSSPWTIGHEGGGVVVEVGDDVTGLSVGDLVVVEPNFVCRMCEFCLSGRSNVCVRRTVVGAHVPGIFAERVAVPAAFAWKLPAGTPKNVMATVEPTVVAYRAVDRYLPTSARNVLVVGAGSQGLSVVQRLVARGLTPAVSEPSEENRSTALSEGARDVADDPAELFDLVFETSGAAGGYTTALDRAQKMAQICLIGQPTGAVPTDVRRVVQLELNIQGHVIYNHPHDFGNVIKEYVEHPSEVGLREPVGPGQAVRDILDARALPGKIVIDLEDWD